MQFVLTPMRYRRVAKLQTRNLISVKQSIFAPCSILCAIAILLKNSLQFAFGIFTGTETDGYGYDRPRLRMGTDTILIPVQLSTPVSRKFMADQTLHKVVPHKWLCAALQPQ